MESKAQSFPEMVPYAAKPKFQDSKSKQRESKMMNQITDESIKGTFSSLSSNL
jgi:hypothetical protein